MVIFETSFYIQICTFCQNKLHICSKYYEGQRRVFERACAQSKRIGGVGAPPGGPGWASLLRTRPGPFAQADSGSPGILDRPGFIEADRPEILLEPDSGR
jgi:hypothetical protein